jgi:hypothetical protein
VGQPPVALDRLIEPLLQLFHQLLVLSHTHAAPHVSVPP